MRSHVSLFAGIDAIGIAAEQHGYTTTHCVESDPYCRAVLAKRLPSAVLHDDVRSVGAAELGTGMDLLSGGFPCQDLSSAGKNGGIHAARSGLWHEYLRIIRECQPKLVLIENVAALKGRGLDVVVAGLARAGYGCWWDCVPALAVGAPHLRDRIWITAVPLDHFPHAAFEQTAPSNHKMPRAGCSADGDVWALEPAATVKACKAAMGAVKRADGVTWLTKIDQPLWPTAAARDWKSGAASPATHARNSRPLNETVALYPTPTARPRTHTPRPVHHGAQLANEVAVEETRMRPTPRASPNELRTTKEAPSHGTTHGRVLAGVVCDQERAEGRVVPPPSMSAGSLNPDWVEWLMGLPVGWTDIDCGEPAQLDWLTEHGIPRVARDVPNRKQRLMAIGNSLVWWIAYLRIAQAHRLLGIR